MWLNVIFKACYQHRRQATHIYGEPGSFYNVVAVVGTPGCILGSWKAAKIRGQFKAACSSNSQ